MKTFTFNLSGGDTVEVRANTVIQAVNKLAETHKDKVIVKAFSEGGQKKGPISYKGRITYEELAGRVVIKRPLPEKPKDTQDEMPFLREIDIQQQTK